MISASETKDGMGRWHCDTIWVKACTFCDADAS